MGQCILHASSIKLVSVVAWHNLLFSTENPSVDVQSCEMIFELLTRSHFEQGEGEGESDLPPKASQGLFHRDVM